MKIHHLLKQKGCTPHFIHPLFFLGLLSLLDFVEILNKHLNYWLNRMLNKHLNYWLNRMLKYKINKKLIIFSDMYLLKLTTVFLLLFLLPVQAQSDNGGVRSNQVILNPDGSKTIIIYGVNDQGVDIKTITTIKVTKFLDGSRLISKNIKIFDLDNNKETLSKSYTQTSIIRTRRRDYRTINNNIVNPVTPINPIEPPGVDASPDGR
jgi:hypothetical protein